MKEFLQQLPKLGLTHFGLGCGRLLKEPPPSLRLEGSLFADPVRESIPRYREDPSRDRCAVRPIEGRLFPNRQHRLLHDVLGFIRTDASGNQPALQSRSVALEQLDEGSTVPLMRHSAQPRASVTGRGLAMSIRITHRCRPLNDDRRAEMPDRWALAMKFSDAQDRFRFPALSSGSSNQSKSVVAVPWTHQSPAKNPPSEASKAGSSSYQGQGVSVLERCGEDRSPGGARRRSGDVCPRTSSSPDRTSRRPRAHRRDHRLRPNGCTSCRRSNVLRTRDSGGPRPGLEPFRTPRSRKLTPFRSSAHAVRRANGPRGARRIVFSTPLPVQGHRNAFLGLREPLRS